VTEKTTVADRYADLERLRSEVLARAVDAAKLTIPQLVPPEGHSEGSKLHKPYQSIGARAVNSLASKLLLALFPPNSAFFRLSISEKMQKMLEVMGRDVSAIQSDLAKVEQTLLGNLEGTKARAVLGMVLKHLIVAGNAILQINKKGQFRMFGLRSFVVERDPEGEVIEMVIRERIAYAAVPDAIREMVAQANPNKDYKNPNTEVCVYTRMIRENGQYVVSQECEKVEVPGSRSQHKLDEPPFIVLRWTSVHDEDYGRSMVDEYIGDFKAMDDLSRDLLKASANAAKVIFLRDPNSLLRAKDFTSAPSGAMLTGKATDVSTVGLDKFADFQITLQRLGAIQLEIEKAFLMHTAAQRQAERVTAEEIRFMAQELEDSLGGVYSVLAQELQGPIVRRYMKVQKDAGEIPSLPKSALRLTITTGLEALGRSHDLNKLVGYLRTMSEIIGPDQLMGRMNFENVDKRVSSAMGIDTSDLFLTEQQFAEKQQQEQMQQLAQNTIPGVLQNAAKAKAPA
jgi:hypothetical protein